MDASLLHALYERAVQSPVRDADLLAAAFRRRARRDAISMREDFCGTALLSIAWVSADDERTAVAIDVDREVLRVARARARERLDPEERARLAIMRRDVRSPPRAFFDLIVAPNYSWAIFERDRDLARYFEGAARSLEPDGMLALELFGGSDLCRALVHRHRHPGFTYVWEQCAFDAARSVLEARIHFELADGRAVRDAFDYAFRIRSVDRVRAMLRDAGLARVELLVERGSSLRASRSEPRGTAWNGWLIARPRGG